MSYNIAGNYSVFNCYNYENKSSILSSLDWFSTPCRRILGGRDIDVLAQTYGDPMSTPMKVMTLFFSILISPVAIVSSAALLLKMASLPWKWEAKIVNEQSQQTWDVIREFQSAVKKSQFDQAIEKINARPDIVNRTDCYTDYFKAINQKINAGAPWEEVQPLLRRLSTPDAVELINHAIKLKLKSKILSGEEISQFVEGSLKYENVESYNECYKKILSDALLIDISDIVQTGIKMDLAYKVIETLKQINIRYAQDPLKKALVEAESTSWRFLIFNKEQNYGSLAVYLNHSESIQQICNEVDKMRRLEQLGLETLNQINSHRSTQNMTQEQWNLIRPEYVKFQNNLNTLIDEGEKKYIQAVHELLTAFIQAVDSMWNPNPPEIATLIQNIEAGYKKQTDTLKEVYKTEKLTTQLDHLLGVLRVKRKGDLIILIEKMKQVLIESLTASLTHK